MHVTTRKDTPGMQCSKYRNSLFFFVLSYDCNIAVRSFKFRSRIDRCTARENKNNLKESTKCFVPVFVSMAARSLIKSSCTAQTRKDEEDSFRRRIGFTLLLRCIVGLFESSLIRNFSI